MTAPHRSLPLLAFALGLAAAGYPVAARASLRAPAQPRREPTPDDISRASAAQAKRDRRAARNRSRA